nr:hypothetical protein [Dysosmobacter segnis]
MNIKPIISATDGEIHLLGKARSSKMGNNLLVQEITRWAALISASRCCLATADSLTRFY